MLFLAPATFANGDPLLLQKPALNSTHIVFAFAGDLWIVERTGGEARRLTTGIGVETDPFFSPDGKQIAFTGTYDGNSDVFVVPATGGVPRRLTYHSSPDFAAGWTPDGKSVLFRSFRESYASFFRLFTISAEGGYPVSVPLPLGLEGAYSPDGSRLAYQPYTRPFTQWKRYRGGRTTPIWIAKLSDSSIEKLPREDSNDFNPIWVGNKIYFLSDRSGPVTLFAYDTSSKRVSQVVRNDGLDIKWASAGPGGIVYEQFGAIYLLDTESGKPQKVDIKVTGDIPSVRPRMVNVANNISNFGLSPTGARAVFEARGEIVTVPAEKGDIRNLTNSSGANDRDPSWSPDGRWIACFSDESGEYALYLHDQSGMGEAKKISLGNPPSFFYSPTWSPDSRKIAYIDKRLNLWYVDIEKGTPVRIDTDTYENPAPSLSPSWSSDSRWIAYTKQLDNHLGTVFIYNVETGKTQQVTDGMSNAATAVFDKSGKYLYFTASTNSGPTSGWLDLSSIDRLVTSSVYVVVLKKDQPSPLAPQSDEEKIQEENRPPQGPPDKSREPQRVEIDFDGIGQRILALPMPARNYIALTAGKAGTIFVQELPAAAFGNFVPLSVHRFDLDKRKSDRILEGVFNFAVSSNGEKLLYQQGPRWSIVSAVQPIRPGEGALNLSQMEVMIDPRAEWKQMYAEVWRIQRDFFYDPGLHGVDFATFKKRYEPYIAGITHRADLTYLFQEMLGNMTVGHHNSVGGDIAQPDFVPVGLLGADFKVENGRYRFARVYSGENWNPQLRAPLTEPGVSVVAGEYLLNVNGREVRASDNVYSFFESTANKSVVIRVGPNPDGAGSREVTVVPVANEFGLRALGWIEDNRRMVDRLSNGKLAYIYLPNTAGGGYTNFNRYFFAQVNKEGAIIDDRFNGGGFVADYIIDYLRRPLTNFFAGREGKDFSTPFGAIFGPKVMLVNESSSSGGDWLPWSFRENKLGPLVGKRTWGGLVGIFSYPTLIDGGGVTAPRVAFYNLRGEWDVENHGVAPDIEVEFDPKLWREGRDPQLEKGIEVLMESLKKNPTPRYKRPPYPNYQNGKNAQR